MNLSCGKCKCVRQFSGDPLKCDICGWVCEPIDPNQSTDTEYWQHLRKVRQTPLASEEHQIEVPFEDGVPPKLKPKPEAKFQRVVKGIKHAVQSLIVVTALGLALIVAGLLISEIFKPEKEKLAEQYNISPEHVTIEPKPHGCDFNDAPLGEKHCHFRENVFTIRECDNPTCRVREVVASWKKVSE